METLDIKKIKDKTILLMAILSSGNEEQIHAELDKLLNSTRITYNSRDDYNKNFPSPEDLDAKVALVLDRLQ